MTLGLRTIRQYPTLPAIAARGALPPMVSIVVPLDRTNLVTNPSIELATTGYTLVGGSIARSAVKQYHGTYSLAITPGAGAFDGAFYATVSLTAGTAYGYSCKFLGQPGVPYTLAIATTGGAHLAETQFIGTGRWQWIRGVYGETSSTTRRLYFRKNNSTNTGVFYVDGVQVESCADGILDATTYIDGDQLGLLIGQQPPAYLWTGTPHASTSTRSALTRAGGYLVNLSTYGFLLTGLVSLGMATPNNVSIPYTVIDGARYQRTTKPPRTIALTGRFQADDVFSLMQGQSDMRQAFDRDLTPLQQPLVLIVEPRDECDNVIGDFAQIQCIYAGGLEGDDSNLPLQDAAPTFTMYVPFLLGGDGGAALTVQQSVANANFIIYRSPTGVWQALSTGLNGGVNAIVQGPDGNIYVGGAFINAGGDANADFIAKWDPVAQTWSSLSTGADNTVLALAFDAAGNLYAGGDFANIGGVAASRIAKWNGSAWSALGTGLTGIGSTCKAIVVDRLGNVYAGGVFTDAGGSGADNIAKWNGAAWSVLGSATAINSSVNALAVDANNNLYAGGNFTDASGIAAADRIAKWSGTAWSALSTGMDNSVSALAFTANGRLYAGGAFSTAGGVAAPWLAQWNGTAWSPLGSGLNNSVGRLFPGLGSGTLYASGDFTTANGVTLPDRAAFWNGSTWLPLDADFPGATSISAGIIIPSGALYFGLKSSGTATAAANTTATNTTPSVAYPKIVIKGPSSGTSRIYQIINYTTGYGVWLNYTINAGETAIFICDPQNPRFYTTAPGYDDGGDLSHTILPGSQPAQLYLAPGPNVISFYAADATVTATLSWPTRYNGVADLVN